MTCGEVDHGAPSPSPFYCCEARHMLSARVSIAGWLIRFSKTFSVRPCPAKAVA